VTQAAAAASTPVRQGVFAFDPGRDLQALVRLLQICFQDELEAQDQRWLTDLGNLAGGGSLFGFLSRLAAVGPGTIAGLVWYESGRLVGNVSLMRIAERTWVIANVATHPHFRRRGIGLRLMEAAIERVAQRGATLVGLQVRVENTAAQALYRQLGFEQIGATQAFRAPVAAPPIYPLDDDVSVRRWLSVDLPSARRIAAAAGAAEGPWPPGPLRLSLDQPVLARKVEDWVRGRRRELWLAESDGVPHGVAVAFLERQGGTHLLEVAIEPAYRSELSGALVDQLLEVIAKADPLPVMAEIAADEAGVAAALLERGFRHVRTLDRLRLKLAPDNP
jgi:ribosomal protein S18 acetylase RimI-like enzyme